MANVEDHSPAKGVLRTFIGGLPYHCEEHELKQFMEKFGKVEHIYISKDGGGHHKGFAFVDFCGNSTNTSVFGEHSFKSKTIEVKRNLLNYLFMTDIPPRLSETDIETAIESLGFPVSEALVGTGANGIPVGTACVRLKDDAQVSNVAPKGVLIINDEVISVQAKANKLFSKSPIDSATKKKNHKKNSQGNQRYSGKHSIHQPFDLSRMVGGSPENFPEQDIYGLLQMSYQKLSLSDLSTNEAREGTDYPSLSGSIQKKKLGTSLLLTSQEFPLLPKKEGGLEVRTQELPSRGFIGFDDSYTLPSMSRHNSDCLQDPDLMGLPLPRRLNSYSSSFYSTPGTLGSSVMTPSKECRISYFTFPGRD